MKVFKRLQLISIKNPIFNVPTYFCSIIEQKIECLQISLKLYEVRGLKKLFKGSSFVQKCGPSYKKRRHSQSEIEKNSNRDHVPYATAVTKIMNRVNEIGKISRAGMNAIIILELSRRLKSSIGRISNLQNCDILTLYDYIETVFML